MQKIQVTLLVAMCLVALVVAEPARRFQDIGDKHPVFARNELGRKAELLERQLQGMEQQMTDGDVDLSQLANDIADKRRKLSIMKKSLREFDEKLGRGRF